MASDKTKKATLKVEEVSTIPLREVSGICLHRPASGPPLLVAIGDASAELAWSTLVAGEEPEWSVVDLSELGISSAGRGSQLEGIATDAAGRVLILCEYPAVVYVVAARERRLLATIELSVRDGDELRMPRKGHAASLGEAMLPLRGGRLLVCKEKDPPLLVEFGPVGATALGIDADRLLAADEAWDVPRGSPPRLEALARWPLADDLVRRLRDISDVAAGPDGRIYLLSDQSSRIARLPAGLPTPGLPVEAEMTWTLEGKPEKAEGLDLLPDGRAIVAIDEKKGRDNLLVLGPPIVP
jgi:hypothetical protein